MDLIVLSRYNFTQYNRITASMYEMFYKEHDAIERQLTEERDIDTRFTPIEFRPSLAQVVNNKSIQIILFKHSNNIVGFVELWLFYFYLRTKEVNIQGFFIRPEFRGTGVARQCLLAVLEYIKLHNLSEYNNVYLTTLANNIKAVRLYYKCGFNIHAVKLAPKKTLKILANRYSNIIPVYKLTRRQSSELVTCYCNKLSAYYNKLNLPYRNIVKLYRKVNYLIVDEKKQLGVTLIKPPIMRCYFCPALDVIGKKHTNLYLATIYTKYIDNIGCINLLNDVKSIQTLEPTYTCQSYYMYTNLLGQ